MKIREFSPNDKNSCIEIFKSNCPKYFDVSELGPFISWLNNLATDNPAYSNSLKDYYYVLEIPEIGIVGCAGFYLVKDGESARFAWGMIHGDFHNKGYGTALTKYRLDRIKEISPTLNITLGTSQHTYRFFEKMGFKVTAMLLNGYAENMDRYDMEW